MTHFTRNLKKFLKKRVRFFVKMARRRRKKKGDQKESQT